MIEFVVIFFSVAAVLAGAAIAEYIYDKMNDEL